MEAAQANITRAGKIKSGTVVNRGTEKWQAQGDVG